MQAIRAFRHPCPCVVSNVQSPNKLAGAPAPLAVHAQQARPRTKWDSTLVPPIRDNTSSMRNPTDFP
jgi:hypothetical protein